MVGGVLAFGFESVPYEKNVGRSLVGVGGGPLSLSGACFLTDLCDALLGFMVSRSMVRTALHTIGLDDGQRQKYEIHERLTW